ncbi:MAG: ATPase component of transporter with duplicated ATPase domain [Bacteroidota bacterium]|jgi:ATP-binding cassette subfamily F protein uup|nr:ATPase component of transporter with duplicated ATPase domain [Bacteroidota bacterium]
MNLLSVNQLSKSFGDKVLFKNINFGISYGDKVALIAKNGSGKSTLFKILQGIEIPDSGDIAFRKELRISFLSQEPVLDENHTIEQAIYAGDSEMVKTAIDYNHLVETHYANPTEKTENQLDILTNKMNDLEAWNVETQIMLVCANLGLNDQKQKVSTLSGGQKKRLALAQVILNEPDLLIMDEPTNHLDVTVIEWLEDYLRSYKKSILLVTHDRYFLDEVCDRIIEIDNHNLYEYKGKFAYYMEKKAEREMMQASELEKAKNLYRRELEWVRKQPRARTTKSKSRVDAFYDVEAKARKKSVDKKIELSVKVERIGSKIIEVRNLKKAFGEKKILEPFTYTFIKGEKIGIVGPNGIGKSTFINMLQGIEPPDSGTVTVGDTIVFGYYSQKGIQVADDKRVIEVVKDIAEFIPLANGTSLSASGLLTRFNFAPEVQYGHVSKLSGGEKRRLYLLTVLVKNPNFLILDEPTNDLDIITLQTLEQFLLDFQGCVLIVSHDRYFLDRLVDHVFAFEGNGVVKDFPGNYSEYRQWKYDSEAEEEELAKEQKALGEKEQKAIVAEPTKTVEQSIEKVTVEKKKLSFKEQKELETLDEELPKLEARKAEIERMLASGISDVKEIEKLSNEFTMISSQIDEKTMRWMELQD